MGFFAEIDEAARKNNSLLCVGLDPDPDLLPQGINPLDFNKAVIDATSNFVCAYKPNLAFYECYGVKGWQSLNKTINYINNTYPGRAFTIADAKRGDIGNTSQQYARAMFDKASSGMEFDAVTVAPYMGED